jgi:hypothetical protein
MMIRFIDILISLTKDKFYRMSIRFRMMYDSEC